MKTIQLKISALVFITLILASCGTFQKPEPKPESSTSIIKPQGTIIPFDSPKWKFIGNTKIEDYLGQKALNLGVKKQDKPFSFGLAMLKDMEFSNGIIEYDVAFNETRTFAGLRFHTQQGPNFENFYMRAHQSGNPDANQYMPNYNGIPSWQLYYGESYSAPSNYVFNEWMHIKIVVSGKIADIYIMDMQSPALTVQLKREETTGGIGLWGLNIDGDVRFANFAVKPMDNPEIKGTPKPEKTAKPGSVLSWLVSNTFDGKSLAGKTTLTEKDKNTLEFTKLKSDLSGVTNLAKIQGVKKNKDTVFAKVVITSKSDQLKKLEFGFSDQIRLYLNNKILFEGDDLYRSRDYRFLGTVGLYDAVYLPLKKGDNELLFAITENVEDRTGWAVQARFENMEGIEFKTN